MSDDLNLEVLHAAENKVRPESATICCLHTSHLFLPPLHCHDYHLVGLALVPVPLTVPTRDGEWKAAIQSGHLSLFVMNNLNSLVESRTLLLNLVESSVISVFNRLKINLSVADKLHPDSVMSFKVELTIRS